MTTIAGILPIASTTIAAVSATISAVSASNSRHSAQASETALRETRQQRQADNARRELASIGEIYDQATVLIEALAIDLNRDPAAVARKREQLARQLIVTGLTTPGLERLLTATEPLTSTEIAAVRADLTSRSAALHRADRKSVV